MLKRSAMKGMACGLSIVGWACTDPIDVDRAGSHDVAEAISPDEIRSLVSDWEWQGPWEAHREVIRTAEDLDRFWDRAFQSSGSAPDRPVVDFDSELAIVAAMGGQPNSGYGIRIDAIYVRDGQKHVVVVQRFPGGPCGYLQLVMSPWVAVAVPSLDQEVVFVEESEPSCSF